MGRNNCAFCGKSLVVDGRRIRQHVQWNLFPSSLHTLFDAPKEVIRRPENIVNVCIGCIPKTNYDYPTKDMIMNLHISEDVGLKLLQTLEDLSLAIVKLKQAKISLNHKHKNRCFCCAKVTPLDNLRISGNSKVFCVLVCDSCCEVTMK